MSREEENTLFFDPAIETAIKWHFAPQNILDLMKQPHNLTNDNVSMKEKIKRWKTSVIGWSTEVYASL